MERAIAEIKKQPPGVSGAVIETLWAETKQRLDRLERDVEALRRGVRS